MDIDDENLRHFGQCNAKSGAFAVAGICANPSIIQMILTCLLNDLKRKFYLCMEFSFAFRYPRSIAALWVLGPFFWKVQSNINRRYESAVCQGTEYCDLTIVNFAKSSQPLSASSHGHFPLLGKAAFIDYKASRFAVSDEFVNIMCHMVNNRSFVPCRMRQKLLKVLTYLV